YYLPALLWSAISLFPGRKRGTGVEGNSHLTSCAVAWSAKLADANTVLAVHQNEIDDIAFKLYSIEGEERRAIEESLSGSAQRGEEGITTSDEDEEVDVEVFANASDLAIDLMSYLAGCPFGRWDIRYATGERPAPDLPDPFAPLPICPPGM